MNLYLDIETIPSQSPEVHARIAETITPPGNISKADTIAQWTAEKKPAAVKEAIAKTALDGSVGHICAIGWAWDDRDARSVHLTSVEQERGALVEVMQFFQDGALDDKYHNPTIVGHNVVNFDIRFLWQRAIVLGIPLPRWFPRDPKPWGNDVFDTMTAFAGARGTIGMERLCLALGMAGKGDIDGSMIGDLWAAGKFEAIAAYCRADVERTRSVHRRMLVAFGEAA